MVRTAVTLKIPVTRLSNNQWNPYFFSNVANNYRECRLYANTNKDGEDYETNGGTVTIPSTNVPKNFVLSSFKIPLQVKVERPSTDGVSFAIITGDVQYSIDLYGNVTDSNFISYLNSFISKNGATPEIKFDYGSWHFKYDGKYYGDVSFIISHPELAGTLVGGLTQIFRPIADISVGHSMQIGFSHVYQLIREDVADGDSTFIYSYSNDDNNDIRSSIVNIGFSIPNRKRLVQLRPIINVFLDGRHTNSTNYEYASATIGVTANGHSDHFSFTGFSSSYIKNTVYNTFEGVFDMNSPVIQAINSYREEYGIAPVVDVEIKTEAQGKIYEPDKEDDVCATRLSQVYFEAVYEDVSDIGIYDKINGKQTAAMAVYQKAGGKWSEISVDEGKTILNNNTIRRG